MKQIALSQGKVALVDDEDFLWLSSYPWCALTGHSTWYAIAPVQFLDGRWRNVRMHRLILNAPRGLQVDHINRNGLDNRRSNLRLCTATENSYNSVYRKQNSPNSSRFKGVFWNSRSKRWVAQICIKQKQTHLGTFRNEEDAARAYDAAAIEVAGPFARLNYPIAPEGKSC